MFFTLRITLRLVALLVRLELSWCIRSIWSRHECRISDLAELVHDYMTTPSIAQGRLSETKDSVVYTLVFCRNLLVSLLKRQSSLQ